MIEIRESRRCRLVPVDGYLQEIENFKSSRYRDGKCKFISQRVKKSSRVARGWVSVSIIMEFSIFSSSVLPTSINRELDRRDSNHLETTQTIDQTDNETRDDDCPLIFHFTSDKSPPSAPNYKLLRRLYAFRPTEKECEKKWQLQFSTTG